MRSRKRCGNCVEEGSVGEEKGDLEGTGRGRGDGVQRGAHI